MYIHLLIGILAIITLLAVLLTILYVTAVFLTKQFNNVSIDEAKASVDYFLSKTFSNTSLQQAATISSYPVYIGFNGYNFRTDLIERYFCKLSKYWDIFYFERLIDSHPNLVVYQFRIYEPLHPEIKLRRIASLVQNVAEEALATYMHEWNCYVPLDNYIAVNIRNDILRIAIAKNENGFKDIAQLRKPY